MMESLFNKVAALQVCNFIKKRIQHSCFPINISKFLRTPSLKSMCERLLLLQHNHMKQSLETRAVLIEIFMLC